MSEAGRPSKYEPAFCDQARELCIRGATDEEMAEFFGVHRATFYRWKLEYPEFCDAIKSGKEVPDERVERSLYQKAAGYEYTEQQAIKVKEVGFDDKGRRYEIERVQLVDVRKTMPADTGAAIFWLKNRRSDAWRDKQEFSFNALGEFDESELRSLAGAIRQLKAGRAGSPDSGGDSETTRH